ncbi:hypothetical protein [Gluconobacter wancherniae]|uniref:Uncharacterized protein n=1 Tax=Gluconobacter wancherniae NBRC 103581 TaxID=656744 RepID=A0A511AZK7_9PROT|nr:hypothetical protein [Gluconobacter wancherniae]MBF0852936.1 hypothetical protein [Gluconobacter wancherniae]MBS1087823.1 hypothetical protein [Gluconobacter wancherniae]MBS1093505.1 hypothetical protein [Gluconobacter wancherniae]GBD56347.1 hypothetical protein NBRC103581_00922 [Gluconobacter wancherniae NBRC 103581]GBR63695.1 hypothetical protein AA103581_0931 [Gluconobacter wancherniae NBRC 103581]
MKNSLTSVMIPLLTVAALGVLTPWVAHHVSFFLGLPGAFWASAMLTLEIVLLCVGLAAVRPTMLASTKVDRRQSAETILH